MPCKIVVELLPNMPTTCQQVSLAGQDSLCSGTGTADHECAAEPGRAEIAVEMGILWVKQSGGWSECCSWRVGSSWSLAHIAHSEGCLDRPMTDGGQGWPGSDLPWLDDSDQNCALGLDCNMC